METFSTPASPPSPAPDPYLDQDAVILGNRRVYFERVLKIKDTERRIVPFALNREQDWVDRKLDAQRERTGMVRALVLKGRKQGMSTYVAGRYYMRTATEANVRTLVISHRGDATETLYGITKTFWRYSPGAYRPRGKAPKNGMAFPGLGSEYKLATAGSKDAGRSDTINLLHWSEVAHSPNAEDIATGAIQTVPRQPGTEIIGESTANGMGGYFYEQWQLAEKGVGDYIAIFVPWFWHAEYRAAVGPDFRLTDEERALREAYGGRQADGGPGLLDDEQFAWRRAKIAELQSPWRFKQEYPCDAVEAFQTKGVQGLIPTEHVVRAKQAEVENPEDWMARVLGVDCARTDIDDPKGDATRLIDRQGRVAGRLVNKTMRTRDTMQIVAAVVEAIVHNNIDKAFVDIGGLGAGIYDRLVQLGYGERVVGVNFGGSAMKPERFANKRAEMWGLMAEWFAGDVPVSVPVDDVLHRHLTAPTYEYDDVQRLKLERKKDLKKRLKFSPDGGDALALTFAQPVVKAEAMIPAVQRVARLARKARREGTTFMAS